jgi:hypothetical protein
MTLHTFNAATGDITGRFNGLIYLGNPSSHYKIEFVINATHFSYTQCNENEIAYTYDAVTKKLAFKRPTLKPAVKYCSPSTLIAQ